MDKPFLIRVFGKAGCDKCKTLNQRLDKLLAKPEWKVFDKQYCDVLTEEGLVPFCEAECINPQRIPAMLICQYDEGGGEYEPMANTEMGQPDKLCAASKLYHYLGLQTDYSATGKGVLSPKMIASVLLQALENANVVPQKAS